MKKIVLIGSGNLASSLGMALRQAGHSIVQVYSSTPAHAQQLASALQSTAVGTMEDIVEDADFYILAIPDGVIGEVAQQLPSQLYGVVLHTSGSTGIDVLNPWCRLYGVLYPLQTFSKERIISDFRNIPVFIEASSPAVESQVNELACSLSTRVEPMSSEQRRSLHVAAVFSCNFVNHLLAVAFDLLQQQGVSAQYLRPLVEETIKKAFESGKPFEMQTGPAVRGDVATLQKHLNLLAYDPLKKQLYEVITDQIISFHK